MTPSPRRGKETSNELSLWGATLYDFYYVHKIPTQLSYMSLSTGSRLALAMREFGELEQAKHELAWADREPAPKEVYPYHVGLLIREYERKAIELVGGQTKDKKVASELATDEPPEIYSFSMSQFPFARDDYPDPWPLAPFTQDLPILQQRIPLHLLPEKLIVHDPDRVLKAKTWGWSRGDNDVVKVYKLQLGNPESLEETRAAVKAKHESKRRNFIALRVKGGALESGPEAGPTTILVSCPPRLEPSERTPEGHLFFSCDHRCGTGSHSIVLEAEWELPRSLLVEDQLCETCLLEKVDEELRKYPSFAPSRPLTNCDIEFHYKLSPELDTENETRCTIPLSEPDRQEGTDGVESFQKVYVVRKVEIKDTLKYTGPALVVHAETDWLIPQGSSSCPHSPTVPLTAKVKVAAKLAFNNTSDCQHLLREAQAYRAFPSYLFQHYNGYNIVPPLHDPVPVGAVVPQFYGYYVPDFESNKYSSAILLLELCGKPIIPGMLDLDDRQECASLVYRLHFAGFQHNSVAERNIVQQLGPLTVSPELRGYNGKRKTHSFRLIDFGRTKLTESVAGRAEEESQVADLCRILHFRDVGRRYD
jgi:hypothetical protein